MVYFQKFSPHWSQRIIQSSVLERLMQADGPFFWFEGRIYVFDRMRLLFTVPTGGATSTLLVSMDRDMFPDFKQPFSWGYIRHEHQWWDTPSRKRPLIRWYRNGKSVRSRTKPALILLLSDFRYRDRSSERAALEGKDYMAKKQLEH